VQGKEFKEFEELQEFKGGKGASSQDTKGHALQWRKAVSAE
jgi:hypothetical protein